MLNRVVVVVIRLLILRDIMGVILNCPSDEKADKYLTLNIIRGFLWNVWSISCHVKHVLLCWSFFVINLRLSVSFDLGVFKDTLTGENKSYSGIILQGPLSYNLWQFRPFSVPSFSVPFLLTGLHFFFSYFRKFYLNLLHKKFLTFSKQLDKKSEKQLCGVQKGMETVDRSFQQVIRALSAQGPFSRCLRSEISQ